MMIIILMIVVMNGCPSGNAVSKFPISLTIYGRIIPYRHDFRCSHHYIVETAWLSG